MDIDEKVSALYKIRKLDKEEYVPVFDKLIQEIFTDPKPEYVIKLCAVFYDEVYFHEVMYGLIHAVEALAKGENYSYLISLGICNMAEGRDWSKDFIYGILNTKDELMKYPEVLRQLSEEQRRHIVGILQEIKDDDEEIFGERISWIMSYMMGEMLCGCTETSNPSSKRGYVRLAGQALGRRLLQGSRFGVCFCDGQLQLICPKSMR